MSTDKPYSTGIFETIVNVHFGKQLYLILVVNGANQSSAFGPYGPAPGVVDPVVIGAPANKGAKLLDVVVPRDSNNAFSNFSSCFIWTGDSLVDAWVGFNNNTIPGGQYAATNHNSCPWPGGGPVPPGVSVAPINFEAGAEITRWYLFSIDAGDAVALASVTGILPFFDSGLDTSVYSETTSQGAGLIKAIVYSTVKGKITRLSQLIDFHNDGIPRPTEDDACVLSITHANQGIYKANVRLDKNPADAQIDNYGKTFQPYKVTLDPASTSADQVPAQPPVLLG